MKELHTLYISDIMKILPHAYPMLLVDKVIDIDYQNCKGTGVKCISFNEWFFQGHFPKNPVMPGVLIIEAMAQTCILISSQNNSNIVYLSTINNAKFKNKVVPGDTLLINVKLSTSKSGFYIFECVAKVNETLVAKAEIGAFVSKTSENFPDSNRF